ncbi:MAG TPA: SpoIIE family protein phosphatase [Bryobacteraceae bacterium]|nr:SpoIIE family protein phosphatase [Bryobacteraceae bacterium]
MARSIPVDDPSRVAEIRRATLAVAQEEGLDEKLGGNAAIVSTEVSTNLLKYARQGEVFISPFAPGTGPGVEILAVDRGPGIKDLAASLVDGYSSAQSSGTGLGAISRLSQEFDIYTEVDKGTVLVSRIGGSTHALISVGSVIKPLAGEDISGDAWGFSERDGAIALVVADGLGHGVEASRASSEAVAAFRRATDLSPISVLRQIHDALHSTRGAAVAVANIDPSNRTIQYAGIGNIGGVIAQTGRSEFMVSHSGTAGYQMPRVQEFSYSIPEGALIIMHSDGLTTNWNLDVYPGLRRSHPSVIAGVLYRDATRHRDDVCVVVAKIRSNS